jgi:hypothetical protein
MRNASFCFFLFVILFSCQKPGEQPAISESDTRVWVREAYDSVDYMKISPIFNHKRALVYKDSFNKATVLIDKINTGLDYAQELLRTGQIRESLAVYNTVSNLISQNKLTLSPESRRNLYAMIGIAFMRNGEIENCVQKHNHQSCFIPIKEEGIHQLTSGSKNAIRSYELCLKDFPDDLETKYLLNIAYMTLGLYPDSVPAEHRIDPEWFALTHQIKRFAEIAPSLGVNRNGHAGGVVIDDFTNDGWLDIVVTSWSPDEELIFYVNNQDGSFKDRTAEYNLDGQVGILNLNQTDYNNDGWLDLYLMRGAWLMTEGDIPNTLLKNTGNGFEDVTLEAGLTKHAPGQTAAWSDFNLDGYLDVVIPNESLPNHKRGIDFYINQQDGTFRHASQEFGLMMDEFFKGCVATDINNDRYPDILLSSRSSGNFLFVNQIPEGKNHFRLLPPEANPSEPMTSFPCWSFDYDNDGNEDLFISAYSNEGTPATHWMLSHMGKADPGMFPKLYRNNGNLNFQEVGQHMGLTEVAFTMGCNFGDIDTDGFLDFYLATGNPQYQSIVPNKMYLNMAGKYFEDVSYSGGFANIQKGHGVSFADFDRDGDEDIYVVMGGAFDGDGFYNCLFENPNEHNYNWLVLKLEGDQANKPAIGARVKIVVTENGQPREIHRTVTSGASFGANSLALEVGLRKASEVKNVTVQWPCKDCPDQEFTGMQINNAYHLKQNTAEAKMLPYTASTKPPSGHEHHH